MNIQSKALSEHALSVLKWIQAHEDPKGVVVNLADIATDVHLTAAQVEIELERLHGDRLVDARVARVKGTDEAEWRVVARITGAGLRALGD